MSRMERVATIKRVMKEKKITQEELAHKLGCTRVTIGRNLKTGCPERMIDAIEDTLGIENLELKVVRLEKEIEELKIKLSKM